MPQPFLQPGQEEQLIEWWKSQEFPTIEGAFKATGIGRLSIRKYLSKHGIEWDSTNVKVSVRKKRAAVETWRNTLAKLHSEAFAGLYVDPVVQTRFPLKMLFCPDSHGNYWDAAVSESMLERDGDATLVVTNEIMTIDAFSHYRQEYDADLMGEFLVTGAFVEMLRGEDSHKRRVIISNSNHQERFLKFIADHTTSAKAVKASAELWSAGMYQYAKIKTELTESFVVQVGRAVFGHPDSYMLSQGSVGTRFLQRCTSRYPEYGLEPPFQFAAVGHPHRLSLTQAQGCRAFVAEAGCQCHVPRYAVRDNSTRPCTLFPMVNGYITVTFDKNGNVESFAPVFVKFATIPGREEGWNARSAVE